MLLIEHILSTIAPHLCVGCGREGSLICSVCVEQVKRIPPRCYNCQQVTDKFKTCPTCRRHSDLWQVRPFAIYEGIPRRLVRKLKFEHVRTSAKTIALLMTPTLADLPEDILITHVPTATSRVRERGYDQAALIARELAICLGREYAPLLSRYGQQRQVGKNRKERRAQMQKLFASTKRLHENKHILLVDDVLTTGATLEACAGVLKAAGAGRVSAVTFAAA